MASIRAIGFDMDHTLVTYNRENFEALAFRETLKKFIDAGYPEELQTLKFNPNFVIRGLLVDQERGNLLKVDGHKYVKIAFHGHHQLSKHDRHVLYNAASFKPQDFLSIDTFFALSEVQLFTEIVDYMRRHPNKIQKSFKEVYRDLRTYIDLSHRDGTIKNEVMRNPQQYIDKDKHLAETLVGLVDGGKSLFLLTNSMWDYTSCVMSYLLSGEHEDFSKWQNYFDYIFVGAGKPGFFTGSQPFYEVLTESGYLKQHSGPFKPGKVYQGGNARLFQDLAQIKGDEVLYAGDHIYGDIIRSKGIFNWRTLLVVEELVSELPKLETTRNDLEQINRKVQESELLDEEAQRVNSLMRASMRHHKQALAEGDRNKARSFEKNIEKLKEKYQGKMDELAALRDEIKGLIKAREQKIHPVWGEIMRVGLEKSRFSKQVEEYACLYTSRISNLRFYSPLKKFNSPHDIMPHDL